MSSFTTSGDVYSNFKRKISESKDDCDLGSEYQEEVGPEPAPKKKKGKKKRFANYEDSQQKSTKRPIPNYFVAVQINNHQVHERLAEVQEAIVSKHPTLAATAIPLPTLHLTMLVTYLPDDDSVERAKMALNESAKKITENLGGNTLTLPIEGIGDFKNVVTFAKVGPSKGCDHLHSMANDIEETFAAFSVPPGDTKGFKPHITLFKLSKAPKLAKRIKRIEPALYDDHVNSAFGEQDVYTIQLCSMFKPKDQFGYYHVACEAPIGPPDQESRRCDVTESSAPLGLAEKISRDMAQKSRKAVCVALERALSQLRYDEYEDRRTRWRKICDVIGGGSDEVGVVMENLLGEIDIDKEPGRYGAAREVCYSHFGDVSNLSFAQALSNMAASQRFAEELRRLVTDATRLREELGRTEADLGALLRRGERVNPEDTDDTDERSSERGSDHDDVIPAQRHVIDAVKVAVRSLLFDTVEDEVVDLLEEPQKFGKAAVNDVKLEPSSAKHALTQIVPTGVANGNPSADHASPSITAPCADNAAAVSAIDTQRHDASERKTNNDVTADDVTRAETAAVTDRCLKFVDKLLPVLSWKMEPSYVDYVENRSGDSGDTF